MNFSICVNPSNQTKECIHFYTVLCNPYAHRIYSFSHNKIIVVSLHWNGIPYGMGLVFI